jgi:hypothetical protein
MPKYKLYKKKKTTKEAITEAPYPYVTFCEITTILSKEDEYKIVY